MTTIQRQRFNTRGKSTEETTAKAVGVTRKGEQGWGGGGIAPETKRLGEGSAWGRGAGGFGGAKAEMENMRRKPDLAAAAAIAAAAGIRVPRDWTGS